MKMVSQGLQWVGFSCIKALTFFYFVSFIAEWIMIFIRRSHGQKNRNSKVHQDHHWSHRPYPVLLNVSNSALYRELCPNGSFSNASYQCSILGYNCIKIRLLEIQFCEFQRRFVWIFNTMHEIPSECPTFFSRNILIYFWLCCFI